MFNFYELLKRKIKRVQSNNSVKDTIISPIGQPR